MPHKVARPWRWEVRYATILGSLDLCCSTHFSPFGAVLERRGLRHATVWGLVDFCSSHCSPLRPVLKDEDCDVLQFNGLYCSSQFLQMEQFLKHYQYNMQHFRKGGGFSTCRVKTLYQISQTLTPKLHRGNCEKP
jgi:hypothetical protein